MKRYLSIILGMLLVFGFAASALAMHADIPSDSTAVIAPGDTQITLSGEIRERYFFLDNPGFVGGQPNLSYFDSRVRLGIDAKVSPNTEGFVQIETSNPDPTNPQADINYWGSGPSSEVIPRVGPLGSMGGAGATSHVSTSSNLSYSTGFFNAGNSFGGMTGIQNAWILHHGTGLLGVEAGLKIGLQPMALGYAGSRLFFDHTLYGNDGVIAYVLPVKELEIAAVYNRVGTGSINLSDNANAYVILASYTPDKNSNITFDATYVDVQNIGEAPAPVIAPGPNSLCYAGPGGAYPDFHFWNFGLRGKTAVGGFKLMADGELQTATLDLSSLGIHNQTINAWATKESIGYTLDPVTLSLDFAYGSGDSGSDANKYKTFITAQGAEEHFTFIYDYMTPNAAGNQYGGLQNTWYIKLGGMADVTKDVNVDVNLFYLQAAESITAKDGGVGALGGYGFANPGASSSKDIGTELDAKITYKVDKNLKWWVEGGVLWAGNFWKNMMPTGTGVTSPYGGMSGIQLNF